MIAVFATKSIAKIIRVQNKLDVFDPSNHNARIIHRNRKIEVLLDSPDPYLEGYLDEPKNINVKIESSKSGELKAMHITPLEGQKLNYWGKIICCFDKEDNLMDIPQEYLKKFKLV